MVINAKFSLNDYVEYVLNPKPDLKLIRIGQIKTITVDSEGIAYYLGEHYYRGPIPESSIIRVLK